MVKEIKTAKLICKDLPIRDEILYGAIFGLDSLDIISWQLRSPLLPALAAHIRSLFLTPAPIYTYKVMTPDPATRYHRFPVVFPTDLPAPPVLKTTVS